MNASSAVTATATAGTIRVAHRTVLASEADKGKLKMPTS